jgi:4-amino-4-deoxy-L-arabinose transferase-like glycosyltransferase
VATERAWWAAVLVLALAARLLYALLLPAPPVISDASGYDAAARRLLATGSYAFPVGQALWSEDRFRDDAWGTYTRMPANAWSMPGYTVFLAAVYRFSGTGAGRFTAVRCVQALLGTLTVALVFALADALLGRRAAWVAFALNAFYPPSVWAAQVLLTETVFTLLLLSQVAIMVWAARSRRPIAYVLLGVATAAATYARPVALLVPGLLLAFEAWRWLRSPAARRTIGRQAACFGVLGLATAAMLAPWWLRNQRIYGVFMLTTSASVLPRVQGELLVRRLPIPDQSYAQYALPALTANDDRLYAIGVAKRIHAIMPPSSAVDRSAAREERLRLLGRALTLPFTQNLDKPPILSWRVMMQVLILALAGLGVWRHRRRAEVLLLLAAVPAYIVLLHWEIAMLLPRYLYPAMPFLLILAGAAFGAPRTGRGHPVLA